MEQGDAATTYNRFILIKIAGEQIKQLRKERAVIRGNIKAVERVLKTESKKQSILRSEIEIVNNWQIQRLDKIEKEINRRRRKQEETWQEKGERGGLKIK